MDSIDITPTKGFPHMYDFIGDKVTKGSPIVLVVLTFVIIIYYILFSYLGVSVVEGAKAIAPSPSITFIEVVMWGMFIFLVLINGVQYFFQVDIKTSIKNLFTPVPEVDITVTSPQAPPVPEIMYEDQVFHVPNNIYTYNDAKAVCKAYGSRLATYGEIENAYTKEVLSGVDLGGLLTRWHYIQHRWRHGKNFKKERDINTIAEGRVLMGDL